MNILLKKIYFFILIISGAYSPVFSVKTLDFAEIDQIVDKIPSSQNDTIESLGKRITVNFSSELEKTRALYRWIAMNIAYDAEAYLSGKTLDGSAENTLKVRKSVCEGYANLFQSMAKVAGLESVKIDGLTKGYRYQVGNPLPQRPDHSWNAVKINGEWKLLDVTWGSGSIENRTFKKNFEDHYFLTNPEEFIFDHFPVDSRWQLLPKPKTRDEFSALPFLRPAFFKNGLTLLSHKETEIKTEKEAYVEFGNPKDAQILASLIYEGSAQEQRTFVQKSGNRVIVSVRLPRAGAYTLRIFAKKINDLSRLYPWAMDYKVVSNSGTDLIFPRIFSHMDKEVILKHPVDGILTENSKVLFELNIPGADAVAVKSGKDWAPLVKNGDNFSGEVLIKEGTTTIFARYPGEEKFMGLFQYQVK